MHCLTLLRRTPAALLLALGALTSHAAQTNVGVSVQVQQPGFYGRVDIGNTQPPVIYPQPVIIEQRPVAVYQRPIYLRVPPGHERNWARYCGRYQACGQPVYFVHPDARFDGREWRREERHDDRHDHDHWDRDHDDRGREGRDDHDRGHDHGHRH